MSVDSIIKKLCYPEGTFPREALTEAIVAKAEITPRLLAILERANKYPQRLINDEGYWGHIFAMFLLAQFREKRAYPLIVEFFSNPDEEFIDTAGDVVTEDLARILASVCDGDTSLLKRMVEDDSIYEFCRSSALKVFQCLFVNGIKTREEVIEYYRYLFNNLERKPHYIWGSLIVEATDIYATELYPEIKKAFDDDLEQENIIDLEYVDFLLAEGEEIRLAEIREKRQNRLVENTIDDIEDWASFDDDDDTSPEPPPSFSTLMI